MKTELPRLLIAAVSSGSGKTTLVCGLLQALLQRGLTPAAFKCGPDFIDPLFHRAVLGTRSGNLDLFFTPPTVTRALLAQNAAGADLAVLEGVMGYYDGLGGLSDTGSAYHLARETNTPVVLVLDARGASLSLCAQLKGFLSFRRKSGISAVLLNRCSPRQFELLGPILERECGVQVLGYLPQRADFAIESRHLGLVADKLPQLREKISAIAAELKKTVDLDALLKLAQSAPPLSHRPLKVKPITKARPRIAVARDAAFSFYYTENLQLLEALGAELVFFSPLDDSALPPNTHALYLGGGYPELHAKRLSTNREMLSSLREASRNGLPIFAECGGFLYLHEHLIDPEGKVFPMAGLTPGSCHYTGRLGRFGYIQLTAQGDTLLCKKGEVTPAHEFHYYDSENNGSAFLACKPLRNQQWHCIQSEGRLFAGFPHLYFYANPVFAEGFVQAALTHQQEQAEL